MEVTSRTADVIVVGGGTIGLAAADGLAALGRSVLLFDAAETGRASSWAASGSLQLIVPDLAPPLLRPLAARSTELWPAFAEQIQATSRMDVELRNSGLLRLVIGDDDATAVESTAAWLRARDVSVERLSGADALSRFPHVNPETTAAFYEPRLMQVRPPRLLHALRASATARGVVVRTHEKVDGLLVDRGRVTGVATSAGKYAAAEVVLAAGAWISELTRRSLGLELPVRPIRGQIVLLEAFGLGDGPLLLGTDGRYLIPRADGRVLAGSTFENAGFDLNVTASGVRSILDGAVRLVPQLGAARIAASWAGLRPESPDRLPYLGRIPGLDGVVFAAGHFRDGILLTPVTTAVVCSAVLGTRAPVDLTPFAPDRRTPAFAA